MDKERPAPVLCVWAKWVDDCVFEKMCMSQPSEEEADSLVALTQEYFFVRVLK